MQTIEMLQTIKWILSQYSKETQGLLFGGDLHSMASMADKEMIPLVMRATHEVSRVRSTLLAHRFAAQVLGAFNLDDLIAEDWPIRLSSLFVEAGRTEVVPELHDQLIGVVRNWSMMRACVEPVQNLTTPSEVIAEEDFDEIWTIDIRSEKETSVDSLSKVFKHTHELYSGIAQLMDIKQVDPLRVIYVDSGSSERFDLCGLGEPIKQAKLLIIEVWQQIRYSRIEDTHRSNKVVLERLTVFEKIEAQRKNNTLSDEEAAIIRTGVLRSTLDLLGQGVLIREIPSVDNVQNQKLLEERQQRLLTAPEETVDTKAKDPTKSRRRRKKEE